MRVLLHIVFLLSLSVGLSGCFEEKIKSLVDKEFPPIDIAQQRATAVELGQKALVNLRDASFVANFDMDDIRAGIELLELEKYNVTDLKVEPDQQMIFVDLAVDGVFDSKVVSGLEPDQAKILDLARPEIVGSLRFGVSIGSRNVDSSVLLKILPKFTEVKLEKLELLGTLDIEQPAGFITAVINKFSDNINGELTRADFTEIRFPTAPVKEIDFTSSSSQSDDAGNSVDLRVEAKPLSEPIHIGQSAVLIQRDSVVVLLEVSPTALPAPGVTEFEGSTEFADFQTNFSAAVSEMLPIAEQPEGTWAVVAKSFLANVLNKTVHDSELCFSGNATLAKQTFSEKIEIPDENDINCTPTRECTKATCNVDHINCQQAACTNNTDCSYSHIGCGGNHGCPSVFGLVDPACKAARKLQCEAEKAALQTACRLGVDDALKLCEIDRAKSKLTCEKNKASALAQCEAESAAGKVACEALKSGEKLACETGKETLKRLSRTGNLANINGNVQGAGSADICVRKFLISDDVSKLALSLDAEGSVTAQASVKYVPLDIAGHLLCEFPFTEDKTVSVSIPRQGINTNSDLAFENTDDGLKISTETSASNIGAKISPSPQDLILQSYNMTLACSPVAPLLHSVNLSVGSVVPEMKGDISIPVDKITNEMIVEPFELLAGEDGPKIKLSFFVSKMSFGGAAATDQ